MDAMTRIDSSSTETTAHPERNCIITVEHVNASRVRIDHDGTRHLEKLVISGWVVCRDAVERLLFERQGEIVGVATIGVHRPDVGAAHPDFPGANHAGFTVAIPSLRLVEGQLPVIDVSIWSGKGRKYGGRLPLQRAAAGGASDALAAGLRQVGQDLPIECVVDVAALDATGKLRVGGWALAASEIVAVRISAHGRQLGHARTGLERSDVAANYPAYGGAAQSGFEMEINLPAELRGGLDSISVEVVARSGDVRLVSAPLVRSPAMSTETATQVVPSADAPDSRQMASPIRFNCDLAEVDRHGRGLIRGWAVSPGGIRSVSAAIDGGDVGSAELGSRREDVGIAYPDMPGASDSGFIMRFNLGRAIPSGGSVLLRIEDGQGRMLETSAPLQFTNALATEPAVPAEGGQAAPEDFRCYLDSPAIRGPKAIDPIAGAVTVAGWAIARHGLKSVAIHFGDMLVGHARLGSRRPDIAAVFPDWPGALMSGFGLFVPAGLLKNGRQKLSLVLTDARGVQRTESIEVDVQKTAEGEGDRSLRRKVSVLETDTHLRIIQGAGVDVDFHLLMVLKGGETPVTLLSATLASLAEQTYGKWYLHVLTDGRRGERRVAEALATLPPDVAKKVQVLKGTVYSLEALSTPAASASSEYGRYAVHLHAGDKLAVDCLMQVAMSNVGQTPADFIYGDERRASLPDGRMRPFLKPSWSPEFLLSMNYVGRFWFASMDLMACAFPSVSDFAAASEYERVLRLTEHARHVRRVPSMLSERHGVQTESEPTELAALQQTAARRGIPATVEAGLVQGSYRFRRKLTRPGKVSIIIPTIAARGLIKTCIESIRRSSWRNYEIILIDNIREAQPEWKAWFRANADQVIEVQAAFNWSLFNNIGAEHASGDYLLFLNDDIEVLDIHWLEVLMEVAQLDDVGVVGPYLLYPDRTVQHAGLFLSGPGAARHAFRFAKENEPGYFGLALTQRDMIGVTGACMLMRREVFDALGGFNPAHSVINNDLDFCLRCNDVGLQVIYTPHTRLIHHELVSRERLPDTYDVAAFAAEWTTMFSKGDPFFHPGLSRNDDYYSIDTEQLREVYAGFPIAHRSDIRRIVVFKLDHIGDFITALPAIRRLKERFSSASLAVVVSPAVASLARTEPAVDDVFDFAFFHARSGLGQKEVGEEDLLRLKSRLEPYRFDLAVDLRKHPDTRPVLQYSGARLFAGFDQGNKYPWLDFVLEWEGDPTWVNKRQHVAGDLLNLVDAIANGCEEDRNTIHRSKDDPFTLPAAVTRIAPQLYGKPVIGVHPASGNQLRQWPVEHFAALIDLLVERLPVHVAIIGGPDEQELAEAVLAQVRQRKAVWSLVGMHKLSELPDVLQTLALFVGNNSGPKHIAAGLGVPTVAVHSAVVSTEEWGPLGPNAVAIRKDMNCAPCYRAALDDCHRNIACMREITPESIYSVCLRFLALASPDRLHGVS